MPPDMDTLSIDDIEEALRHQATVDHVLQQVRGMYANSEQAKVLDRCNPGLQPAEYCLTAHQRHQLRVSVDASHSLAAGGILDTGNKEKSVVSLIKDLLSARPSPPAFTAMLANRLGK